MIGHGPALTHLADFVNGYGFTGDDLDGDGIPVVRIQHLLDPSVEMDRTDLDVPQVAIQPGDLVFSWSATLAARIWDREPALLNQHLFRVDPHSGVDRRWLKYVLDVAVDALSGHMHGSAMTHITRDMMRRVRVPFRSLQMQRAIADYLDTETARIDALIAKKRRMIELLNERWDRYLYDGITGELTSPFGPMKESSIDWLGSIPAHWGTPWLGANHSTQLGKMLNSEAAVGSEQRQYLKNTNVKWDTFQLDDLPTMSFDAADRARCHLRRGDLLVCEGGEVGRAAVWSGEPEDVYFQKALHRVRPLGGSEPRFLMYCLWAAASLNVFAVEGSQATIVHLTGEKLREHRFPWPPISEQQKIVRLVDQFRQRTDEASRLLDEQIDRLTEHRQALITAAVTGELDVSKVA